MMILDLKSLFELIKRYLYNKIATPEFRDILYVDYFKEDILGEIEESNLSLLINSLDETSQRYSEFEEDHKNYPGAFYTEEDVRKSAEELFNELKKNNRGNAED